MTIQRLTLAVKYLFISIIGTVLTAMFTKISICLFLLRIFDRKRYWRWGLYSIVVVTVVTQLAVPVNVLVQCRPTQKLWNPRIPGKCWSSHVRVYFIGYFNGAATIIVDVILSSLPVVFLWNIQLSAKAKTGICCLMGMGFFSGICAVVRTIFVHKLTSPDITWECVDLIHFGALEALIGIIAACIPTLRPLVIKIKQGFLLSKLLGRKITSGGSPTADKRNYHGTAANITIPLRTYSRMDDPENIELIPGPSQSYPGFVENNMAKATTQSTPQASIGAKQASRDSLADERSDVNNPAEGKYIIVDDHISRMDDLQTAANHPFLVMGIFSSCLKE